MFEPEIGGSSKTSTAYSRHLLKCISKFLPNNPNFCPSIKEIEEEDYYKNCVKTLLTICIDNDSNLLIDDILKLLKEKLSKYEEFPIIQDDEDLADTSTFTKLTSPGFNAESKASSKNGTPFVNSSVNTSIREDSNSDKKISPSSSFLNMDTTSNFNNSSIPLDTTEHYDSTIGSDFHTKSNQAPLSNATLRLLEKHTNIRKSTKYPIRSLGISNYVLLFLRLITQIFEVGYFFTKPGKYSFLPADERKKVFEKSFHLFYSNSKSAFKPLKFGVLNFETEQQNPSSDNNISCKVRPQKLNSKTFKRFLRFLIAIKSNVKLDDCVSQIVKEDQLLLPNMKDLIFKSLKTSSIHVASNGSYLNHNDQKLDSTPQMKDIRDMIDKNVEYLLSFLANSNTQDYMQFLEQILLINPGPEAVKDRFVLQELKEKYVKHQEFNENETEHFINEELKNTDNNTLNMSLSNPLASSINEGNPRYILIPAYLSLFTSDLLFATEYISFVTFQNIKDLTLFIQFIHRLHKTYKRSIFRKCMLLSFVHSLKIFFVSKSHDYLHYTHDNTSLENAVLKKELTSLFNSIYGSFDTLKLINDIYGNASGTSLTLKHKKGELSEDLEEADFLGLESFNKNSNFINKAAENSAENTKQNAHNYQSLNNDHVEEIMDILNFISKDGLALSKPGDAYHFGSCSINDELLNPGDIAVLRSLTIISLYNVDVFSSYLKKLEFKGLEAVDSSKNSVATASTADENSNNTNKSLSFVKSLRVKTDSSDTGSAANTAGENSPPSTSSSPTTILGVNLECQTKNVGSVIKNNLFKMPKLPSYYTLNKENKFWSSLLKHFGTPQALDISDRSNLYIFATLMQVCFMGGFLNIKYSSSPITKFAKRLSASFDKIFQLNSTNDMPRNFVYSQRILNKSLQSKTKGVVENMISSLLLFPDETLANLEQKCSNLSKDQDFDSNFYYELYCISEAMKFFFHIPNHFKQKISVYNRIVELIKNITFKMSGKLIGSLPYLDEHASDLIDEIIFENYQPEQLEIFYYLGNKDSIFMEQFFGNDSGENFSRTEYYKILQNEKSSDFGLLDSSRSLDKISKFSNTHSSGQGVLREHKLNKMLCVSLIANGVNILRTCSMMTQDALCPAFKENLGLTEKILLSGILNNDETLTKECVVCYKSFFQQNTLEYNHDSFIAFYCSASKSALLLSVCAFNLGVSESTRLTMLQTLENLLDYRQNANACIFNKKTHTFSDSERFIFEALYESLFRTIFINLTFNDVKAHPTLRNLCSLYIKEVDFYCLYKQTTHDKIDSCYYSFIKSIANCTNVFGPIAFQRHIRADILTHIDRPSKAIFDCFLVLSGKVFEMTIIGQGNLVRDDQTRFRNYCGIIASFIGVFKVKFLSSKDSHKALDRYEILISKQIDFFIEIQCHLLDSTDLLTRENSKDILSSELHPGVFGILFDKLKIKLDIFGEMCKRGEIEKNFFLLEQVLGVIRSILERKDISLIILCTSDVLDIIQKVLDIILLMDYNSHYKYKVIIHTSKVILYFKNAEDFFFTKGAHALKNYWLQIVFNWFNSVAFVDLDLENLTKSHREMDLQKRDFDYLRLDTSIECAKALSFLTEKISLEAPLATTTVDMEISKRSAFENYFNILLKALKRSSDHESVPFVLRHKTLMLNENVLSCLTNLLSSTPDIGLDFVLPIAYNANSIIRRTLFEVLIELVKNIKKDKSVLSFAQEDAINNFVKQAEKCPQILRCLASLCPVSEVERLATSLLKICGPKKLTHIFISDLIENEISMASRNMDILRRNSLATRSLAIFSRIEGFEFLNQTIKPLMWDVVDKHLNFEIEKPISDDAERSIHIERFINCMDTFCDNALKSFEYLPHEFFYISQRIFVSAKKKFPGSELIAVGSFIFLRFFCPAIVNPETENIKNRISSKNRRTLILVAKVLQNLANKTIYTLKWPLLDGLKEKIDEWSLKIFDFLEKISDLKRPISINVNYSAPIIKLENLGTVHKLLYSRYIELRTSMIETVSDHQSFIELIESSKVIDDFMLVLGQPTLELTNDIPKIIRENSEKYSLVYDFMNRHYLKVGSTSEVSGLIFVSADADGVPRLNLSLNQMEIENIDVNEIVYKLLFLESGLWTKKFNIFLDGTAAATSSTDKLERIMGLFLNLIPRDSFINLNSVIFYNINEAFLLFWANQAKKAYETFGLGTVKHEFYTSNCSAKVFKTLQLQRYSVDIYNDVRVTLYNTSYYESSKNRFVPVTLKIGNHNIQLVRETPKRIKFSQSEEVSECHCSDVYFIKNMTSACASDSTGIPHEFTIFFKDNGKLILSTQKYLEILKILHYAKSKLEEESTLGEPVSVNPPKQSTNEYELDLLVRILLVALSGFSNTDDATKARAYWLLAVTQKTFNLETGYTAYPTIELSLPDDTMVMVKSITKAIAQKKPEMTYFVLKNVFEGLLYKLLDVDKVQVLNLVSYWIEYFYEYILMDVNNNGKDRAISVIRLLIKCTLDDPLSMNSFKIFIWSKLLLVSDLLEIITDEVITHAMDRESEGSDWAPCISILSMIPSVSVAGLVVQRLLKLINKLIPTLTNDNNVNSWSEVIILVSILKDLSFDSCVSFEGFVSEILYIISMLIDVKPIKIKTSLLKILINMCNSFITSGGDDAQRKANFNNCIEILTSPRAKYVFGLSRDNSTSYYSSTAASLLSKVNYMSELINYILLIMQIINKDSSDEVLWKAKYKDMILEAIFGEESYISARAMMYLSILCRDGVYEDLIKNLFTITLKVLADVSNTEEAMLHLVTHVVSYGNIVAGISNNNPRLIVQVCWLCHSFFMSSSIVVFHAGLVASANCLEKLLDLTEKTNLKINDLIWESNRQGLGDCLEELELIDQRFNSKQHFVYTHVHFISKATIVSHTRAYGIKFLKMMLHLTLKEDFDNLEASEMYHTFLFLLYILEPADKFNEFYKELHEEQLPVYKKISKDFELPELLFSWMIDSDNDSKNIILYQVSLLASIDSISEASKLKLLSISLYMCQNRPQIFFAYMGNIIEECAVYEEKAVMVELVEKSFELSSIIVTSPYYGQLSELENSMLQRLKDMKLEALNDLQTFQKRTSGYGTDEKTALMTLKRKKCLIKILEKIVNDDYNSI